MPHRSLASLAFVLALTLAALAVPPVLAVGTRGAGAPTCAPISYTHRLDSPMIPNVYLHVPKSASPDRTLQVLFAFHGMGGRGTSFAAPLVDLVERNGWLLVAPDLAYRDWRDPAQVRSDEMAIMPALRLIVDQLPDWTGCETSPRILAMGFSRGGQVAHRFALAYPEFVVAAATLSAGTYTLPYRTWGVNQQREAPLPLPFGVGDLETTIGRPFNLDALRSVQFFVGVGANDNVVTDTPTPWDPYLGRGRVTRAQAFHQALQQLSVDSTLQLFPGVGHAVTPDILAAACAFLRSAQLRDTAMIGAGLYGAG